MSYAFTALLLKKYNVSYRQCPNCGLLQTEDPFWLNEAYGDAVGISDTGLLMRNLRLSKQLAGLLYFGFNATDAFLDVAGGYGLLTRLMRDYGFDYYWEDLHCSNLIARGFEADKSSKPFSALSAFEVLEHVYNPLSFIQNKINQHGCRTFIFTTELYDGNVIPPKEWWYYSFKAGQHITFYNSKTLETLAARLGLQFYTINGLHIFTDKYLRNIPFLKIATGKLSSLINAFIIHKLGSRTFDDHLLLNKS